MSEKVRLYRHFSAGELDNKFVRYSMALARAGNRWTAEKRQRVERLIELIDEERERRLPERIT